MATATVKEELEILEPSSENRDWTFKSPDLTKTYTQKPLNFFRKVEFVSLLGEAVDSLSTSEKPLNLAVMFSGDANIDNLVGIVARVAAEIPETLQDMFCIALNVPKEERAWVKWRMDEELSDDDGFAIMELFIEQNAESLVDFFETKGQGLLKRAIKKFALNAPAPSSKPTKRTAPNTPKV